MGIGYSIYRKVVELVLKRWFQELGGCVMHGEQCLLYET